MSKSINATTITDKAISMLSSYNQAVFELRKLSEKNKADKAVLEEKKNDLLDRRSKALEEGVSIDKVAVQFSTVEVDNEIRALAEKYKADCEPWRAGQRNARKLIPKDVYESYKDAYAKGKINAYEADVKNFLTSLGVQIPTPAQLNKLARLFVVRTSGARRAGSSKAAEGNYISEKSKVQYGDIFMLAILQWLVADKKVLEILPDNTLVRKVYDK